MTTDPEKARAIRSQLISTFNEIAPHFDVTRYKPWPESGRFVSTLKENSLVLDLGCGNGRNSVYLAKEGMDVVGLDFSNELLRIARNKSEWRDILPRVELVQGDIVHLPFKDGIFDAALFIATIHHLPTPKERLKSMLELKRCLKQGKKALVSAWAQEQDRFKEELKRSEEEEKEKGFEFGDIYLPWKMGDGRVFQRYYHLFSRNEFENLMEKCGMGIVRVFYSSDNHYAELKKI